MTIYAEIVLSGPDLFLSRTIRAVPDVFFRIQPQPLPGGSETLVFYRVVDGDFETLDAALDRDPSVSEWSVMEKWGNRRVYRIAAEPDVTVLPPSFAELGAQVLSAESADGGWQLAMRLPDRETLASVNGRCADVGIDMSVKRLATVTGPEDGELHGLTEEQRELLLDAYGRGYFEVPRRVSQDELAADSGISKSAVSTHLRRALSRLIEATLVESERSDA